MPYCLPYPNINVEFCHHNTEKNVENRDTFNTEVDKEINLFLWYIRTFLGLVLLLVGLRDVKSSVYTGNDDRGQDGWIDELQGMKNAKIECLFVLNENDKSH